MATSKTNRILSLVMAMLLFVSSSGFSIDLHYCQGQLKSFSLLGEAKSCHQQLEKDHCKKQRKACHTAPSNQKELGNCKKDCCSNKTIEVEPNEEAKKLQSLELSQEQVKFLAAFVPVFLLEKIDLEQLIIPYLNYIPPLLN